MGNVGRLGEGCLGRTESTLEHPDTETQEWVELGWGGADTVPGGGWGGLSPRKPILNLSLVSISLHN